MTKRLICRWSCACGLVAVGLLATANAHAADLVLSPFDQAGVQVRYGLVTESEGEIARLAQNDTFSDESVNGPEQSRKSPAKAFFMSLLVPGAGQWYYGSRIKPFVFLGVEAAAWGLHANWHAEGEDKTDEFEAFNRTHWSEDRYTSFLTWTYGIADDEEANALEFPEITHHLPDDLTQQYYEMTGKYDQFSWGWDDATLEWQDQTLNWTNISAENAPPRVNESIGGGVPTSINRQQYETMRNDANNAFDRATRMAMVAIGNHVVSALEAYFVTQKNNKKVHDDGDEWGSRRESFWSNLKVKPSLKSMHHKHDTPYVRVTYSF